MKKVTRHAEVVCRKSRIRLGFQIINFLIIESYKIWLQLRHLYKKTQKLKFFRNTIKVTNSYKKINSKVT